MKKVLKFSASWCGPCKMLSKTFESIETAIPVEEIDIDEHSHLAVEYGVRGVPTLVMIDENIEVKRITGNLPKPQLESWLND